MFMENSENNKKASAKKYALFSVLSFVLLFLLLAFFSLVMVALDLDKSLIPFFTALSLTVSTLAGSYFLGKLFKRKAIIVGAVNGFIIFLLVSVISAFFSNGSFSLNSLFNLLIIFLSSIIGAIFGVNSTDKRRIK